MSASLVGSEMCIRDRSSRVRCRPQRFEQGGPRRKSSRRRARSESAPVSYTHLTLPTICSV
eukprot:6381035-Alexandrium_andersonii.AAC.1